MLRQFALAHATISLLLATGCVAEPSADAAGSSAESALGSSPIAAGITRGSLEEEGVLLFVNDRAIDGQTLVARTGLPATLASAIIASRKSADGRPRWFGAVDEIDQLPDSDQAAFERVLADAKRHEYVERSGFDPATSARLAVPANLGRPPTSNDVTVEAGFDGKSPDEVVALVRGRLMNTVDASNERFVAETIRTNHKSFTLAVGNLFANGSPPAAFANGLGADALTVLGTMSAVMPTLIVATKGGTQQYYARGASGRYESIAPPKYPVIMRARVKLGPLGSQGVRVFYPAWAAPVLRGPTGTITEGD